METLFQNCSLALAAFTMLSCKPNVGADSSLATIGIEQQITDEEAKSLSDDLRADVSNTNLFYEGRRNRAATNAYHMTLREESEKFYKEHPPEKYLSPEEYSDLQEQMAIIRSSNVKSRTLGYLSRDPNLGIDEAKSKYNSSMKKHNTNFSKAKIKAESYMNVYKNRTGWDYDQAVEKSTQAAIKSYNNKARSDKRTFLGKPISAEKSIEKYRNDPYDHLFRNPYDSGRHSVDPRSGEQSFEMPNSDVWGLYHMGFY